MKKSALAKALDVNESLTVKLGETETIWVLDVPSLVVPYDNQEEYQHAKAQNDRYAKVFFLPTL